MTQITLVFEPTVIPIAEQSLNSQGLREFLDWIAENRPECLPEGGGDPIGLLLPHGGLEGTRALTDNEMLVELAGRSCYMSFGAKAGRPSNSAYTGRMLSPSPLPHASVFYHAKMTFFIAGISRRLSHELIRHYVGADRSEEGSPSQESTRYTLHTGHFAVPPKIAGDCWGIERFREAMQHAYDEYLDYVRVHEEAWLDRHGEPPKGADRKRIYEAASGFLPSQACTSFIWTANPASLHKMFVERCHEAADSEFQRLARKWRDLCHERWPNLFPESNPEAVEGPVSE